MISKRIRRISIETNASCDKACWFCYNHSGPERSESWDKRELIEFVSDCAQHGVEAVSFGGGEPLQYPGIFDVLEQLRGVLFRSMTTNGLLLDSSTIQRLLVAAPDKIHLSIHFPGSQREVARVLNQVTTLAGHGIQTGINLLVTRSTSDQARRATDELRQAGISPEQIVFLPMRMNETPTPEQVAAVANYGKFQSTSCLTRCQASSRFCSIDVQKRVGWCSYTSTRRKLPELTYRGLLTAIDGLGLRFCGGTADHEHRSLEPEKILPVSAANPVSNQQADFPAAHSMDTTWYARDRDGQVASFDSGENGAVPSRWYDEPERSSAKLKRAAQYEYREVHQGIYTRADELDREDSPVQSVRSPSRIDASETVQQQLKHITFTSFRFSETPFIQPLHHFECEVWRGKEGPFDFEEFRSFAAITTSRAIIPLPGAERLFRLNYHRVRNWASTRFEISDPHGDFVWIAVDRKDQLGVFLVRSGTVPISSLSYEPSSSTWSASDHAARVAATRQGREKTLASLIQQVAIESLKLAGDAGFQDASDEHLSLPWDELEKSVLTPSSSGEYANKLPFFIPPLAFLTESPDLFRETIGWRGQIAPVGSESSVVFCDDLSPEEFWFLHSEKAYKSFFDYIANAQRLGMFLYSPTVMHDVYQRTALPTTPLKSPTLSPSTRAEVEAIRLPDVSFCSDERFQLPRDWPSISWWNNLYSRSI